MRKLLTILLSFFIASSASAQYCGTSPNAIPPDTNTTPGFYPPCESLPCITPLTTQQQQLYYYGGVVRFAEAVTVPSVVRLYDVSGREVMAQRGFTGDMMPLGDGLSQGVYIIRVENSSYTLSGKVPVLR